MKKFFYSFVFVLLAFVLNAQVIAASDDKGLDMNSYASWAGYVFIAVIALAFMIFLHYSEAKDEEWVEIEPEKPVNSSAGRLSLTSEISATLNLVYYLIISLILLHIILLVLFIT